MKAASYGLVLALLCSCTTPAPVPNQQKIQGFGTLKLGESLQDAKTALEKDNLYYSFTGRTLDYETMANGDRWYVSAQMIKTRVAAIVVAARPMVAGGPATLVPEAECDRRFNRTLDSLRRDYGDESSGASSDGTDLTEYVWIDKDRSITVHRHKVETGCDRLSIAFADFSIADHF